MSTKYLVDSIIDFDKAGFRSYKQTEAVSQRESLKNMVLKKYLDLHGHKSKKLTEDIYKEVNYYFYNETVNEAGIRILKLRLENLVKSQAGEKSKKQSTNQFNKTSGSIGQHSIEKENNNSSLDQAALPSVKNPLGFASRKSQLQHILPTLDLRVKQGDTMSVASGSSSKQAKSIYYLEGRDEDEWAKLVQFDAKMFQKEQQMLKQRNQRIKENLKAELDRQMREKQEKVMREQQEDDAYFRFQGTLTHIQDEADKKKREEKLKRIEIEKIMIEKQKLDTKLKRRQERLKDKELDDAMITRMLEEKRLEEEDKQKRREREIQRTHQMLQENQINKNKVEQEMLRDRNQDIAFSNQYAQMLQEQEDKKEKEKRDRYQKLLDMTKQLESSAQVNQKEQLKQEDDKMLHHILDTNRREEEEDYYKQKKKEEQKIKTKQFLDKQVEEKMQKKLEEEKLNKKQAEIWEKDRDDFLNHESQRNQYIKMVNKAHQQVLNDQIKQREFLHTKGKMTLEELKQNKNAIQNIIHSSASNDNTTSTQYKKVKEIEYDRPV